jgi:hypothetical protein
MLLTLGFPSPAVAWLKLYCWPAHAGAKGLNTAKPHAKATSKSFRFRMTIR